MIDPNLMLNVGIGIIGVLGAYGIGSSIVEGNFMKYPHRMYLSKKEVAFAKELKLKEDEGDNK